MLISNLPKATNVVIAAGCLLLAGCGLNRSESANSPIPSPTRYSVAPEPSGSTNIIDLAVASEYRQALEKSLAIAQAKGLTELWSDPDGNLVQIVAFDSRDQRVVQEDVVAEDVQELDSTAIMPAVLIDELDALEGNAATDVGSVTSQSQGTFTILNHIDDSTYITIYELDSNGLIATAKVSVDNELSATAIFNYSLTAEGKSSFAKLN